MTEPTDEWENLWLASGTEGTLLVGFNNPELRRYTGMTLSEVAAERGTSDADTIIDLVIEDGGRVQVVYFMMSEENVARGIALPWVSFASDAQSMAAEGSFSNAAPIRAPTAISPGCLASTFVMNRSSPCLKRFVSSASYRQAI